MVIIASNSCHSREGGNPVFLDSSALLDSRFLLTRKDSFENVWGNIKLMLEINSVPKAKTLFEDLQRRNPCKFADGQLRTLQRRIKHWRAVEGPSTDCLNTNTLVSDINNTIIV